MACLIPVVTASSAWAAPIVVGGPTPGTVPAGYTEFSFNLTGYGSGTAGENSPMTSLRGTFSIAGGGTMSFPGTAAQFTPFSTNASAGSASNPPRSYINFDGTAGTFTRTPGAAATSLLGTWFTSNSTLNLRPVDVTVGPADDGFDQTLLSQIYVLNATPSTVLTFSGEYNTSTVQTIPLSFTAAIPEPASMLAIAGAGAALMVRRRKTA